jgi:alpha-glucosidase
VAIPGGGRFSFTDASLDVRCLRDGGVFVAWDGATPLPSYGLAAGQDSGSGDSEAGPSVGQDFGHQAAVAGQEQEPAVPAGQGLAVPAGQGLAAPAGQEQELAASAGQGPVWDDEARLTSAGDCWTVQAGDLTVMIGPGGRLTFTTAGHERSFRRDEPPRWEGEAWSHRSILSPDAMVLGLGGRAAGLDRRPGHYRLWNTDPGGSYGRGDDPLSMCLPVSLTVTDEGSHLAFYDNSWVGSVTVGDEIAVQVSGGPVRYYVLPGSPEQALASYTALTGRPALPPRWVALVLSLKDLHVNKTVFSV